MDDRRHQRRFSDGAGRVSLHGDMAVINVAPGCEFFLQKDDEGYSMRCVFCSYGAPDERTRYLGQEAGVTALPHL